MGVGGVREEGVREEGVREEAGRIRREVKGRESRDHVRNLARFQNMWRVIQVELVGQ